TSAACPILLESVRFNCARIRCCHHVSMFQSDCDHCRLMRRRRERCDANKPALPAAHGRADHTDS
ncbi:hypothetical protein OSK62_27430, partial [Escherichia coli]|nr:hypothetical protein [Escherichia coli]